MLSDPEIDEECRYRRAERILIILDGADRDPTPAELNLAFKEAREWEIAWRAENSEVSSGAKTP